MSRFYEMSVSIEDYNTDLIDGIEDAANEEWDFGGNWIEHKNAMSSSGQCSLCGGESEEEFANRLAKAIWKANKGFCKVTVHATCLEYLPSETYTFDKEDFNPACLQESETV